MKTTNQFFRGLPRAFLLSSRLSEDENCALPVSGTKETVTWVQLILSKRGYLRKCIGTDCCNVLIISLKNIKI